MLALLLAGGAVGRLLGKREEALILLAIVCLSVGTTIIWSMAQGAQVPGVSAMMLALAIGYGLSIDQMGGLAFASLVLAIMALIVVDRSRTSSVLTAITRPNRARAVAPPIVGTLLAVTMFWRPARDMLGFADLDPMRLAVPTLAVVVVLEVTKPIWRWSMRLSGTASLTLAAEKSAVH